jgi:hypothetical protein
VLAAAHHAIGSAFDPINGGFGSAPKFPQQPVLEFLLRTHGEEWAARGADMLNRTLSEMADGGIHDHLGGGFARYSVDNQWLVPHFEKMLYDNAQLARIYLWAGVELEEPRFITVARSTLDYLLGDLRHPEGGFYSAEDADSEGVEGKFYVWSSEQLEEVLGTEEAAEAARFFGASRHGNFEGANILYRPTAEPWSDRIEAIRQRLLAARSRRTRPGLDDKVVASWNGLALRALAEAGASLGDERYLDAAVGCGRFLTSRLIVDGTVMRSWRDGQARVAGFLEDYAGLALGLFALYAATGDTAWYEEAANLAGEIPSRFGDGAGGLYDTSHSAETLIKRPKDPVDNPLPSGNALAAEALLLLHGYSGEERWRQAAGDALTSSATLLERYPTMVGHHLSVLHAMHNSRELAIVGAEPGPLSAVYWERFRPQVVLATSTVTEDRVPLLRGREAVDGSTLAYLCEGHVCNLPTADPGELRDELGRLR